MRTLHRFFVACGAFLIFAGVLSSASERAGAQENESSPTTRETLEVTPQTALSIVAQLLVRGRVAEAATVLAQIAGKTPDPEQEAFLAAQIAIRQSRFDDALSIYDALLEANPNLVRIRIERARLLLAMGDVDKANEEFAGLRREDLSDGLTSYVDRYISAIRQRQPWTFQLVASALYDSNASAGPDQETVTLFGLPFILSPEAQKSEAWGANLAASGTYRWALSDTWDIRAVAGASHTDIEQSAFDDSLITAQVTLSRVTSDVSVSAGPTAYRRWFGGRGLSTAWGGQAILDYRLSSAWQISGVVSLQDVDYDTTPARDGVVASATGQVAKSLSPAQGFYVYAGFVHEDSAAKALRNSVYRLGTGYAYRWDSGARITIRPEIALRDFEGVQPAFAAKRRDWRKSVTVELRAPNTAASGFAPFVGYSYVRNDSSIDFNSYGRHQVRVGVSYEL